MADSLLSLDQVNDTAEREAIIQKWKDKPQDELLAAKAESDLYIKSLTTRLDDLKNDYLTLREQHQTGTQLKDLVDRLEKERSNLPDPHDTTRDNTATLKPEDIESLVTAKLSEAQLRQTQQTNFLAAQALLKQQFGNDYQSAYKQRLDTLGLTQEFADDLARNHPTVFNKTFELDASHQDTFLPPPRSQQRQATFRPSAQVRDWKYYQELKKNDPRMYLDPKISVQMHNDMIELGSAFGLPED
jgi:ribosomal protein L29